MDIKRILTSVIGLPLVILILILGNKYIMGIVLVTIAMICMKEYYVVIDKVAHPIKWVGYLSTLMIALAAVIEATTMMTITMFSIPITILILFLHIILTNMETTFKDVAYTFLGIFYITFFIIFLALMIGMQHGKILLGYAMTVAWSTDIFAYLIGKRFGKHHFTKVSPKKSIEGSIAGIVGAIILGLIYVYIANKFLNFGLNISYIYISIASLILSIISQIGDLVASSIKRFVDLKDYGNLLPGHGGMLDRIDSLIFMAPFLYMIISLF